MQLLVRNRTEEERLSSFTYQEWRHEHRAADLCSVLQVLGRSTLDCLRHEGASLDVALQRRSMASAEQRGNGAQAKSMRRYQKGARSQSSCFSSPAPCAPPPLRQPSGLATP